MSLPYIAFFSSALGTLIGLNRNLLLGISGLLIPQVPAWFGLSSVTGLIVFHTLFLNFLGIALGFVGTLLLSGLKGGGHNAGLTYFSGFGAHRPGGIILSDKECGPTRKSKVKNFIIPSY